MNPSAQGHNQIERKIGLFTATSIVVANMIGAGIFTTSGIMAANLPDSGWVILCWLVGGFIALAGALCYAELATRMPDEGGEYLYLRRLYHPALGFLTGWTSFVVGFSVPVAASAIAFSSYLCAGLENQLPVMDPSHLNLLQKAMSIIIIFIFTGIHYLGIRIGSGVQNVLTFLKVLLVVGLASLGLIFGKGDWSQIAFKTSGSIRGLAIGTSMMLVGFAYSGWNASAYIAGELKKPRRTLPLSLFTGTLIVVVIYVAINLFIFHSTPYTELQGTITVAETASVRAFGPWMGNGLSILIAFALLSSLSAYILIGPRVYFAMARDKLFFPFAARVHPKYGVPGRSILIQGSLAVVMVLVGSFEQLLVYMGFALSIFPWLAITGIFIARRRGLGDSNVVKVWGYPSVPIFYLITSLGLMLVAYVNRPLESSIAIMTVLLGIPCYFLWAKRMNIE